MSRNYYSEIHLHIVWHTKDSAPLLTPQVEPFVHRYLKQRLVNTPGAFVHEVGGTETHVHLAVSIVPTVLISELVGQLKGSSSHETNRQFPRQKAMEWQTGYGVVSFGTRALGWVCEYVRNQKEHHARGTVHDRLERVVTPDGGPMAGADGSSRDSENPGEPG